MTESWLECVKRVYNENKSKPGYKLKDAMRDAKAEYKKPAVSTSVEKSVEEQPVKKSRKQRKGKKGTRKERA